MATPTRDASGAVTNFVGTIVDITEFRMLEQRFAKTSIGENETPRNAKYIRGGIRLVEEHIQLNWNKALNVTFLAKLAGVSNRTLFKLFKGRGYTPKQYVKKVRLERARAMLQSVELEQSVTVVALSCGFSNLGHFSRDYRLAFDELPSVTLMRAHDTRSALPTDKDGMG